MDRERRDLPLLVDVARLEVEQRMAEVLEDRRDGDDPTPRMWFQLRDLEKKLIIAYHQAVQIERMM